MDDKLESTKFYDEAVAALRETWIAYDEAKVALDKAKVAWERSRKVMQRLIFGRVLDDEG